jgi:ADP-heptose:LPS heptosyltransferase
MDTNIKKILIIRCGALGDLVYATAVIDALILEYGKNIQIDFVCTPGPANLFKKDNRVNNIFILKHKKIPIWLSSQKKAIIKASKDQKYDILINFESGKQFKSLVDSIIANKKIGYFCTKVDQTNLRHMVDITKVVFKDIVSDENFKKSYPRIIGEDISKVIDKFKLPKKYIVISPSNSHNKKSRLNYRAWQHQSWKELINKLKDDISLVLVGGYGEEEFFEPLKPYPKNIIDLVGKTNIPELISVIDNAAATIATDTGTAHISSAVSTPIFCLIGPTPADVTGPYQHQNNQVHIISANMKCSPCYKTETMKNCHDNLCMKNITVNMVLDSLKSAKIL